MLGGGGVVWVRVGARVGCVWVQECVGACGCKSVWVGGGGVQLYNPAPN